MVVPNTFNKKYFFLRCTDLEDLETTMKCSTASKYSYEAEFGELEDVWWSQRIPKRSSRDITNSDINSPFASMSPMTRGIEWAEVPV